MAYYLYHAFTSTKSDSADTSLVRPSNWNDRLHYGNTAGTGPSTTDATVREVLVAGRSYYVRTDGSDSNTGLTNTAGGAFLTIQHAIDVVCSLDMSTSQVAIQINTGTYTVSSLILGKYVGSLKPVIQSVTGTASDVLVTSTTGGTISNTSGMGWVMNDFTVSSTNFHSLSVTAPGSYIEFQNITWAGSEASSAHMYAAYGGSIKATGNYTVSGDAYYCWYAANGSVITGFVTVTFSGARTFNYTAWAEQVGLVSPWGGTLTVLVSVTGTRYNAATNALVYTGGGGATFIPGTIGGTTSNGGTYF